MYNDKYVKAKISFYNVNYYGHKMPKENERYTFLSAILLDSVIDEEKKYYSKIFLEQCKYAMKKKNIINEELNLDKSGDESNNDKD